MIKNYQYPKTLLEAVDVMSKMKLKTEKKNDKSNTQKKNKMEVGNKINKMRQVLHKFRNMKKCYFCGSGTHMLNNCEIRYIIARD